MQQLKDMSREWRVAEAKAASIERAVAQARQAQREGRGTGPTSSDEAHARGLRNAATDLLVQVTKRSDALRHKDKPGRG